MRKVELLSNPTLDELYSIRRVLVGRYVSSATVGDNYGMGHYKRKVDAMDMAIAAFIIAHDVPVEMTEQHTMDDAHEVTRVDIGPEFLRGTSMELRPTDAPFNAVRDALEAGPVEAVTPHKDKPSKA